MKPVHLAGLALLLAGCLPHRLNEPERFFVLYPAPAAASPPYTGPPIVVAPAAAASFYGTVQIVYSDSPGTRSRYRYSFWTEPPQAVLHDQLMARLQGSAGEPRLRLETRVLELFHDAGTAPGVARITVVARLASLPGQPGFAQQRSFSRTVPASSFDAPGAVVAMRAALAAVIDEIVAWVQAQAPQPVPVPVPGAGSPESGSRTTLVPLEAGAARR